MTRRSKVLGSVALPFLILAGIMWLVAVREVHKYRQSVLKLPGSFEKGSVVAGTFTVDLPSAYWILIWPIKYPTGYKFSLKNPTWTDPFVAHYHITWGNKTVADGDNRSKTHLPAVLQRDRYGRYAVQFEAEPQRAYNLTLSFEDVAPEIASETTTVAVILDPHIREGTNYLAALLQAGAIGLCVIGLVVASPFWYSLVKLCLVMLPRPSRQGAG